MTTQDSTRPPNSTSALLRHMAAAALVCLLAHGAWAQDNDDDGVLPFAGDSSTGSQSDGHGGGSGGANTTSGNNNSGSNSEQATLVPTVLVAGDLADAIDPTLATLEFGSAAGSPDFVTDAPVDDATFVAGLNGICVGENADGPAIQGSGSLSLQPGLGVRFVAAQSAVTRIAFLVLSDDASSLDAEIAGDSQPDLVVPLGDLDALDLVKFDALVASYAEQLPGYHATIAFVSIDADGELHLSAVRSHTGGGPLEVLVR